MFEIDIEEKNWDALESARTIRDALAERASYPDWLSAADAVAITGLPVHLAERGLKCLAGLTGADVRVRGTDVEFQIENLDAVPAWVELPGWLQTLRARVMRLWPRLGDSFVGLLAFALLTFLCVGWLQAGGRLAMELGPVVKYPYAVVSYGLLLLGIVLAVGAAVLAGLIVYPIYELVYHWFWGGILAPIVGATPPDGAPEGSEYGSMVVGMAMLVGTGAMVLYLLRKGFEKYGDKAATLVEPLWCFGAVRRDELGDEREFVALLAATDGVIDLGDVMKLYGWTWDHAFEAMTRLMVDYGGDVQVDDRGKITFHFEELAGELDVETTGTPQPIWEVSESPREVFENTNSLLLEGGLAVVFAVLTLPWVWALATGYDLAGFLAGLDGLSYTAGAICGVATSIGVLGFLVGRRLWVRRQEQRWRHRAPLVDWLERFAQSRGELRLPPDEIDETVVRKLGGFVHAEDVDPEGRVRVEIPALS